MALPEFSLRQLLEAGVHFGHQTHRWNPKMQPYIYGDRNGIHIIDLTQTVPLLDAALNAMRDMVAKGGRILFVGTKRQAAQPLADAAQRSAQYFMNHRWLGGTLTNWKTISNSINRLKALDEQLEEGVAGYTKKELLNHERERTKLTMSLGGIREMGGVPDMLFVIDTNKEALAVTEAKKLGIPVVAILDSNSDPDGVAYPVPGNDDAARAIALYCDLAARAVIDGMESQLGAAGFDLGGMEDTPQEEALNDSPEKSPTGKAAEKTAEESDAQATKKAAKKTAGKDAVKEKASGKPAGKDAEKEKASGKPAGKDTEKEKATGEIAEKDAKKEKAAGKPAGKDVENKKTAGETAGKDAEKEEASGKPAEKDAEKEKATGETAEKDSEKEKTAGETAEKDAEKEKAS